MTPTATLPRRVPGEHLPAGAPTRYVGRATVPGHENARYDDAPHVTDQELSRLSLDPPMRFRMMGTRR